MIFARTKAEYDELMTALSETEGPLAFDTETEKFDDPEDTRPWTLPLKGAGFWADGVCGYARAELLDSRLQELFDTRTIVMHNAGFDLSVMEGAGFDVSRMKFYDTMLASYLLNENRPSHALKKLALSVLNEDSVTTLADVGEEPDGDDPAWVEWETRLGEYCVRDVNYTYRLFEEFRPKLMRDGLWKLFAELECPLVDVLRRMTKCGIAVDLAYLRDMKRRLEEALPKVESEALAILKKEYADAGLEFNLGSSKQLGEYLYGLKKYSVPDDFVTPGGKKSTNVEALKYVRDNYGDPIAGLVLRHRELSKLLGTFVEGILKREHDGVIHANFRQAAVHTGRLSCASPNLQQVSRRADEFDIRRAFVARPGHVLVDGDFSQIEPRLAAYFSGDASLLKTYADGGDVHQLVADARGRDRQTGKTLGLAVLYGISGYGLGRKLGIGKEEAQGVIDRYFQKFPGVKKFMDSTKAEMRKTYAVRSILGRKRRFPDYAAAMRSGDEAAVHRIGRQCANAVVQSSAADIMKIALRNVDRAIRGTGARLLLTVHDEVIVEAPEGLAEEVAGIVKREMEASVDLGTVKMKVDPKISAHWTK